MVFSRSGPCYFFRVRVLVRLPVKFVYMTPGLYEVIHHALSPSSNPASLSIFKEPVQIVVTEVTLTSFN